MLTNNNKDLPFFKTLKYAFKNENIIMPILALVAILFAPTAYLTLTFKPIIVGIISIVIAIPSFTFMFYYFGKSNYEDEKYLESKETYVSNFPNIINNIISLKKDHDLIEVTFIDEFGNHLTEKGFFDIEYKSNIPQSMISYKKIIENNPFELKGLQNIKVILKS